MMTSDIAGPTASAVDYSDIVAVLRTGFEDGLTRPIEWRLEQLDRLAALLTEHEADIARALLSDLGKSAHESYLTETGLVLTEVKHIRRRLRWWLRPRPLLPTLLTFPSLAFTVREPLGVCLVIAPWNYPLQLSLTPLIGALAGGNACIVKPSELAPATAELLATLVPLYLDQRAVRVVTGGVPETTALLRERFDHIFYSGNGRVARIIAAAAAAQLTPTTLELGGKCPVFVDGTTNLRVAAERITWAKWTNAGQTCVAPDYVLATPDVADQLERLIPQAVQRMFGDDPHRSPDYGRIVTDARHARLLAYLDDGRVVSGGHGDPGDRYLEPTVLANISPDAPVMQEEIFGPILPIVRVSDAGAAIAFINARDKPLALYAFTSNAVTRRRFIEQTSSGALVFGLPLAHFAMTDLPFGGVGASGTGAYHGRHSVATFTHEKPVVRKPDHPDTSKLFYFPFTARRMRIARRVIG